MTSSAGCPKLATYTDKEQDILEADISLLAMDSPLRGAMNDYANLRAQVRACNGRY